jgi:hypothetical protein
VTFEEFAGEGARRGWVPRTAWVQEPGIRLYLRRPPHGLRPVGVDFDLASMDAHPTGNGALTRFLDRYEPEYGFYVENLLNDRLVGYLERRGYRRFSWHETQRDICMYRPRGGGDRCVSFDGSAVSSESTNK